VIEPISRGVLDPRLRGDDSRVANFISVDWSKEKAASHTTKSRSAIPHQSAIPIRRSGIAITKPHPPNFFAGRPAIAVQLTYFRRTENIHLGSTGAVD